MDSKLAVREAIGEPSICAPVPEERLVDLAGRFPALLVELWQSDGWCTYGEGLFWTVDPGEVAGVLREWQGWPEGAHAFARDAFGDIFLWVNGEVHRLDVHHSRMDLVALTIDFFFDMKIFNPEFKNEFLDAKRFKGAHKRLGNLGPGECYAYFPALVMGGTERIENLRKVKFLENLALLAQMTQ
jgi:hypothetical protein